MRHRPINPSLLPELYCKPWRDYPERWGHTPRNNPLAHLVPSLNPYNIDDLPSNLNTHCRLSPFIFSFNLFHDPFDVSRWRHLSAFYIHHVHLCNFAVVSIGEAYVGRAETFEYTEESCEVDYRDDRQPKGAVGPVYELSRQA